MIAEGSGALDFISEVLGIFPKLAPGAHGSALRPSSWLPLLLAFFFSHRGSNTLADSTIARTSYRLTKTQSQNTQSIELQPWTLKFAPVVPVTTTTMGAENSSHESYIMQLITLFLVAGCFVGLTLGLTRVHLTWAKIMAIAGAKKQQ